MSEGLVMKNIIFMLSIVALVSITGCVNNVGVTVDPLEVGYSTTPVYDEYTYRTIPYYYDEVYVSTW